MAEQGAALQKCNQELVKCIEEIKVKRMKLLQEIEKDEAVKAVLDADFINIKQKLDTINENMRKKLQQKQRYDNELEGYERQYMEIVEESQHLLSRVRESGLLINSNENENWFNSSPPY